MKSNFLSRKFFVMTGIIIGSFVLKFCTSIDGRPLIEDWPFIILIIVSSAFYFVIQGRINIEKIKSIKAGEVEIDLNDQDQPK